MRSANTQKDLLRELELYPVPAPCSLRDTFQLLSLYDGEQGLASLLDRVDLRGVKPDQIIRSCFGRNPQGPAEIMADRNYDPRRHFQDALLSSEFQTNIVANLLAAYPEQRRDVFIHVPKCAGTDLILNLGQQRQKLPVPVMLANEPWIPKDELFRTLRNLVQLIPYHDTFFVYGHILLEDFVQIAGVRSGDRIFSVIRDPLELLISQANYAITRLRRDPLGSEPDTKETLSILGLERLPDPVPLDELKALAMRLVIDDRVMQPNPLCFYLGGPEESARYDKALNNIISCDVEITTTGKYADWLWQRWRTMPSSRHNQSDHWLTADDIGEELRQRLQERIGEDRKLFALVSTALVETGTAWVNARQLDRVLANQHVEQPVRFVNSGTAPQTVAMGTPHWPSGPLVVEGRGSITAHLAEGRFGPPAIAVDFGAEGNGRSWLRDGWAAPEARFTWTAAASCSLEVPKPTELGDYRLRLIGGPFVPGGQVSRQRVTVAANGVILGTATVKELSLIEWELPSAVLGGGSVTDYTFWLPDAVRPRDVTGIADDRLLGFALERVELLRIGEQKSRDRALAVAQGKAAIERYLGRRAQQQAVFRFGFGDTADHMLLLKHGWALPEARFTWTSARVSHCETTRPIPVENYRMRVTAGPFVRKELWPSQRLTISVNGFQLATTAVNDRAVIECLLPAAALKRGEVTSFTFGIPDAIRPRSIGASEDDRLLGFAVESIELFRHDATGATVQPQVAKVASAPVDIRLPAPTALARPVSANQFEATPTTGTRNSLQTPSAEAKGKEAGAREAHMAETELQPNELMMRFESLGENCEFGLVQRRCGAEPLGLFRFSSAPLAKLLAALEARFEGFGAPEELAVELSSNGREFMVRDGRYGFLYHAWVLADEMEPAEIRQREARRLPLLTRKLVEDLTLGRKLLVVRGMDEPLEPGQVSRLLSTLRRYGPNTLLWVVLADQDHPAGFVEWAGPNLLKGYIDRFAPGDNAHDLSLECWITICREADRLRRRSSEVGAAAAAQ